MKVKELIDLLSKEDPEADLCINQDEGYDVSFIGKTVINEKEFVGITSGEVIYGFPEPDDDIKKLIRMRSDWTDRWGEDLLWTVMNSMHHGDNRFPKDLTPALVRFNTYSENKQIAIIRHVLQIRPGEGYEY